MRALLIVPHPVLARALARGLAEEGFAVTAAHSHEEGDRAARTGDHDVIILDTRRPDEDDRALLGRWRGGGLTTPVLLLTTPGSGLAGVADDFLVKPFAWEELLARLQRLIGGGGRAGVLSGPRFTRSRDRAIRREAGV